MTIKERNQNPTPGDAINLRLVTYNSNNYKDVSLVNKVDVYHLDKTQCSDCNLDGRVLVETIVGITHDDEGMYHVELDTSSPRYVIGKYLDIWEVRFASNDQFATVDNCFELYPDLWFTSTIPAVYSFDFSFQPNRIRQGSIKWLIIQIKPNVPRATDLDRYYTNLAIASVMTITIEMVCGQCVPPENDLRTIVEDDLVSVRDKVFGFYKFDTTDLSCGIYNVWFTLNFAGVKEISPKMQLQIY